MLYLEKKKNSVQFCCAGRMKIGFFVTSLAVMLIHSVSSRRTTALCPTIMHALGFVDSTHSSHGSCHHCSPQPAPRRLQHLAHHRHTIRATNRTTAATATATATTSATQTPPPPPPPPPPPVARRYQHLLRLLLMSDSDCQSPPTGRPGRGQDPGPGSGTRTGA